MVQSSPGAGRLAGWLAGFSAAQALRPCKPMRLECPPPAIEHAVCQVQNVKHLDVSPPTACLFCAVWWGLGQHGNLAPCNTAMRTRSGARTAAVAAAFLPCHYFFQSKTLSELLLAIGVFQVCRIRPLVAHADRLLDLSLSVLGKSLTYDIIRVCTALSRHGRPAARLLPREIKSCLHRTPHSLLCLPACLPASSAHPSSALSLGTSVLAKMPKGSSLALLACEQQVSVLFWTMPLRMTLTARAAKAWKEARQ